MKNISFVIVFSLCMSLMGVHAQTYPAGLYPDRITLTWSSDPATTQAVSWRSLDTAAPVLAQIIEDTASPMLEEGAKEVIGDRILLDLVDGEQDVYNQVVFTGLKPSTPYAYRVGDGEHWSAWNQFRTADLSGDFSFIYLGDAQNDLRSRWSRVIRKAFQHQQDARFIIHTGDLINRSNSDTEWGEWHEAAGFIHQMIPVLPTPGNHEYTRDEQRNLVLDPHWSVQFKLPNNGPDGLKESVYYIDYQDLRVISLNSQMIMLDAISAQTQEKWLKEILESSDKKWNIVMMHHPVFSTSKNRDNEILRTRFKPLFETFEVDLILQGHDHTYARGAVGEATRPVYLLSVAGPKMYESDSDRWMTVQATHTQLYQIIEIKGNKLVLSSYQVDGKLLDSFELYK